MSPADTQFAVQTHALSKNYGRHIALTGIDLAIESGTVFGVIGPNGAGKTTTMRRRLDIIRPSSGSATVLGVDPRKGGAHGDDRGCRGRRRAHRPHRGFRPHEVRVRQRRRRNHHGRRGGDIDAFVKTIALFHVSHLAVEEPDLEESVPRASSWRSLYWSSAAETSPPEPFLFQELVVVE